MTPCSFCGRMTRDGTCTSDGCTGVPSTARPRKPATVAELRALCEELLESTRLAHRTSDAYRDALMAYQRWAAKLAPDSIGDDVKRAAIEGEIARLRAEVSALKATGPKGCGR